MSYVSSSTAALRRVPGEPGRDLRVQHEDVRARCCFVRCAEFARGHERCLDEVALAVEDGRGDGRCGGRSGRRGARAATTRRRGRRRGALTAGRLVTYPRRSRTPERPELVADEVERRHERRSRSPGRRAFRRRVVISRCRTRRFAPSDASETTKNRMPCARHRRGDRGTSTVGSRCSCSSPRRGRSRSAASR